MNEEELKAFAISICEFYGLSIEDFTSMSRKRVYVSAREKYAHVAHRSYGVTLARIGKIVGSERAKDHTTILNNIRNADDFLEGEKGYKADYNRIADLADQIVAPAMTWQEVRAMRSEIVKMREQMELLLTVNGFRIEKSTKLKKA